MHESFPAELGPDRTQRRRDARAFRRAMLLAFAGVALLWWIKLLELMFERELTGLGIVPGNPWGLIGVLTAPLVHGSFEHLAANSFSLLVLGTLALYAYPRASARALPLIWLLSGLGTWLIGRPPVHLGASGIGHGLMFFLFLLGVLRRDPRAIAISLVTFFLYGGMVMTVLPREPGISWEYHLCGALAGALAAIVWRNRDAAAPRAKYSWDYEAEQAEAAGVDHEYELPSPSDVPVLWKRPEVPSSDETRGVVVPFRDPRLPRDETIESDTPPGDRTLH